MTGRRRKVLSGLCLAMLVVAPALAADDEAVASGTESAKAWLALVDADRGGESWEAAGSEFRSQVEKDQWAGMLEQVRLPLGSVESRELESAEFSKKLPNAPEGEYVMVVFATSFEKRPGVKEHVATMRDTDGVFRVVGYFIQ